MTVSSPIVPSLLIALDGPPNVCLFSSTCKAATNLFPLPLLMIIGNWHKGEAQLAVQERKQHAKLRKEQEASEKEEVQQLKKRQKLECMLQVGHLGTLSKNIGTEGVRSVFNESLAELRGKGKVDAQVEDLTKDERDDANPMFKVPFCIEYKFPSLICF